MRGHLTEAGRHGLAFDCEGGVTCRVRAVGDATLRVLFLRGGAPRHPVTYSVLPHPRAPGADAPWRGTPRLSAALHGATAFHVSEADDGKVHLPCPPSLGAPLSAQPLPLLTARPRPAVARQIRLSTAQLTLSVSLHPFAMEWSAADGTVFASDRPADAYKFSKRSQAVRHCMRRDERDFYCGLGDKTGPVNLHGRRLRTSMTDALGYDACTGDPLYKHWPFLVVRDGARWDFTGLAYGLFYDNLAAATFDLGCEHNNYYGRFRTYEAEEGDLDFYLFLGPSIADVVAQFARLTGPMMFGPRWTLGYHCTAMPLADAANAQQKIEQFIRQCQEYAIPCSAFHFGSGYTTIGKRRYVFHWNKEKFPDAKKLVADFHAANMRVAANLKPCLLDDHPRYADGASTGIFIRNSSSGKPSTSQFWDGEGAHLDFTNPDAIEWWQEGLQEAILDVGIDAAWNDNNEYDIGDEDAQCDAFGEPLALDLVRPLHALLMTRASLEQQQQHAPSERPYTVTRAGCPGIQRYAQTWSGDNNTSWKTLRWNLRTGLTMGLSGLFNIGHDVGGFAGPSPDKELLVRWFQSGLLHPRFITNSWKTDGSVTTPWLHPSVSSAIRFAIRLRYRLVPYLYTLFREAAELHKPLVRPTFWEYGDDDDATWRDCDEVMVGSSLLAAPVLENGSRQREVYLPKGPTCWWDFWGPESFEPGTVAKVAAPIERLPLFVPAGSILPMTAEAHDFSALHDESSRILRVFPHPHEGLSTCCLYEDDGIRHVVTSLNLLLFKESYILTLFVVEKVACSGCCVELQQHAGDCMPSSHSYKQGVFRELSLGLRCTTDKIHLRVTGEGTYKLPYDTIWVSKPEGEKRPMVLEGVEGLPTLREARFQLHSV
eukprot:SM000407S15252  [mRNA]  locus=s407:28755:33119:- [translate_table: standard]